jgi:YHS domain-containing protein
MKRISLILAATFAACTLTFAAGPVNDVCPVKGKPIRLIFRTTYKGQVVAFCCQDCKAEFEKNPGRYNVKPAEPK